MASLIRDFQRDIVQSSKTTTELLRTAKLISAKLGLNDITAWIAAELGGYDERQIPPDYRFIRGGDLFVFNPYRGWQFVGHIEKRFGIGQSVSEIEELVRGESIVVPMKGNDRVPLRDQLGSPSYFEQQLKLSIPEVRQILDSVRDKLLEWSAELEARGILGNDMTFEPREQQSAKSQVFNIQNFTGVLGAVTNSSVQIYDYSSVHQTLKDAQVPQAERNELENIMDDLKRSTPEQKPALLERAKTWVTKNADILGAGMTIVRKALGLGDAGS